MKSSILFLGLLAVPMALFAKGSCCTEEAETITATQKLSTNSIYQLEATWTDDNGKTCTLAEFRGEPVVITMFFARCEYACPLLVNDMRRLRATLPENLQKRTHFVLVSFDTERDTPGVLHAYRSAQKLDSQWTLLRGNTGDIQALAMVLGVQYKQDVRGQFAHSNLITVLNAEGEIAYQHSGLNGDLLAVTDSLLRLGK